MGSCNAKVGVSDGRTGDIAATIALRDAEIAALKEQIAIADGTSSSHTAGGSVVYDAGGDGIVADASGGSSAPGGLDDHGLGAWRSDEKKKKPHSSSPSSSPTAEQEPQPRLLLPAQEVPPELTIAYIRAKQFILGALAAPEGFSSFKSDFTARGTARWSVLLDAEEPLVQQMLFRFTELEQLELARPTPPSAAEFLQHLGKKATSLLKRKGVKGVFGKSTEFLTAKKHISVAVDTTFTGTELVVQKKGKKGMVIEAKEPVDPNVHVVIHRVGDATNRYPVKRSYLEKNYTRTSLGTYAPSSPPTVFWQVQQSDLISLGTACITPSFACEGSAGERVDVGDFMRIHKNDDDSFEFYCIGKSEWKDTYTAIVDMGLQKDAMSWFKELAKR